MFPRLFRNTVRSLQQIPNHQTKTQPNNTIFNHMLHASNATLTKIYAHPFPTGLSNGTLPIEYFNEYMRQDALYLEAFAGIFLQLEKHKDIREEDAALLSRIRRNTILQEINPSPTLMGGSITFNALTYKKSPTIQAYTDFLEMNAQQKAPAITLASLLPCFVIYRNLSLQMRSINKDTLPSPYQKWISSCSDEGYHASTTSMISLVEKYAALFPLEYEKMISAFQIAANFELQFFNMCYPIVQLQSDIQLSLRLPNRVRR